MSKISIYEVVPVPKLADKLVGTSVGGDPEDITYNFTLSELLNLFIPNIPGNTLQGVLDFGNTATQDIILNGTIFTTYLEVTDTATILDSFLTGETHITGGLYDRLNSIGTAGQVLTSTGTQVEWYTIPTVIPDLQQVLTSGNTAVNNIILTGNLSANNAALLTSTISTSLTLLGTLRDGLSSVGANNQVLSSNVTGVRWVNLPVYSATSPLLYNSGTGVFSIQQANASQNGYLSSADWITFDGKQTSISLTTTGNSGASTLVGATINVPNYTLSGLGGVPLTRTLTINGVTYNLAADRSWTLATGVSSVTATTPLSSTGGVNPDISIQQSSSSLDGYLSSTDWLTFNSKQPAGNYITSLTGEATAAGPGAASVTLSNAAVIGKLLTGLSITGSAISSSDSILTAFGKVQNQINGLIGGVQYQGVWNAATNTPALVSSVGTQGYYYIVSVAGNTNLNGITDWQVGDWAIFNGSTWNKVDNTDLVTSVNGQVGAVSLTTDNIPEGATNLYYLDSRARAALSFAAGSGAYNSTTGVITIPTDNSQILNGAGYITLASLSATSPLSYNNTTGAFSIQVANTTQNGYLSSTDWNTFNGKQDYLNGTGLVKSVAGTISYITDNSANWNTAYNDSIVSAAVTGTATKTLTLNQQDGGTITASWSDIDTGLTSVGVSMPAAFSVANSPLTSNGTIAVTGAGTTLQYIDGTGALQNFPGLTGYVPYTGANQNVDLGEYGISAGYFQADLTPTGALQVGRMQWNSTDGTMDLRLLGNNVTLQIGQENVTRVVNKSGVNLLEANYQVVRVRKVAEGGAQGQRLAVVLAQGNNENNSTEVIGLVTETINNNQEGFVTAFGEVKEINTTGSLQGETWVDGDILYLSSTIAGQLTNVRPVAPNHAVIVGYVVYAHANNGKIYMAIDTGYELGELHNVYAPSPTANQSIYWDTTNSRYQLNTIGGILGYTPANAATTISTTTPLQGGGDLSANRTFSITQSGASTNGYLSSTDWNTFNDKQPLITAGTTLQYYRGDKTFQTLNTTVVPEGTNLYYLDSRARAAISLTTIGSSGAATYNSTTGVFNIPDYGSALSGYVPTSRQLTINGTAYDLSADRSWSVGTVTSVAALTLGTTGTDLSSSVATGTTTPVITLNVPTASAANRGALSAADWSIFNTKVGGVTATSPLFSSGGSTPNLTIQQSSGSQAGYLSSTDWTTFNNKQAAGNYITSLTGEATATGPGAAAVTLDNAAVTGKILTGVNITGGTVLATDTMLTAFGKLQNQVNGLIGGSIYQGTWNASTNTPTLTSSVGTQGYYYIVSVAGTTNLNGITDWFVGDWAIFNGGVWQQVDNTDAVVSVNGQTGAVSLTTDNISEGVTNLYFTNTRARASLSFVAGSGAYNSSTGAITIPTNTSQLTNGANFITLASLSGTAPISYNSGTGAISITQSGTASNGYLSSTDWNTFNNKQSTLTFTGPLVNTSGTVSITQSSGSTNGYLSSTDWTIFNSKQSALTFTGPLVNTSGTVSITQSSGSTNGYLSNTDWTTFNNKQATISLTTTGTSGAATLVGATLNIPNYGSALSGYLPLSGGIMTGQLASTYKSSTGALLLNSGDDATATGNRVQIALGYDGSSTYKHYITTTHNNGTSGLNRIRFYTSDGVMNGTFPTNAVLGLTVENGSVASGSFIKTGGTSSQYLMADGSVSTLTNPVTGTGTTNYIPRFTGATTIANSGITDDGATITLVSRALSGTSATFTGGVTTANISTGGVTPYPNVAVSIRGTITGNNDTWGVYQGALTHAPNLSNSFAVGYQAGGSVNTGTYTGLSYRGFYQENLGANTGTGTLQTAYGIYIDSLTRGVYNYSAYFAQNVGIGTVAPISLLHISQTQPDLTIESTSNTQFSRLVFKDSTDTAGIQYINSAFATVARRKRIEVFASNFSVVTISAFATPDFLVNNSGNTIANGSFTASISALATASNAFVVSDGGTLKFRTAAQVLSDIGGQASGNYVTTDTTQSISGLKTFTAPAAGGTGDYTNLTSYSFKVSPSSVYWRIPFLSNDATISGVFNFQTGKDVYWGEPSDTGGYIFRGRTMNIQALTGTSATFSSNIQVGGSAISGNSSSFYNTAAETSVGIKQTSGATYLALALWNNDTTADSRFLRFFTEATATYRGSIQYDRPGDRLAIYGGGSGLFFDGVSSFSSLIIGQAGIYQSNASSSIASNKFETYNGGATDMNFSYPASGSVTFTNGTIRLNIDASGNTAIGYTTNPSLYKLDVNGTGRFSSTIQSTGLTLLGPTGAGTGPTLTWDRSGGYGSFSGIYKYENTYYTGGSTLEFQAGTLPIFRMVSNNAYTVGQVHFLNSNVGIGTSSPSEKLTVYGAVIRLEGAAGVSPFAIANNNSSGFRIYDYNAGVDRMLITSGGNVGIGTSTPSQLMEIKGTAPFYSVYNMGGEGGVKFRNDGGTTLWNFVHNNNDGNFYFREAVSSLVPLTLTYSTGNVGIRNTSPQAYLDVMGVADQTNFTSIYARAGNSDGSTPLSNQILFGYSGSANYSHGIKTRHQSGSQAGNSIEFWVWKYGDAIGTPAGQRVMVVEGNAVRIANGSGTINSLSASERLNVNGTVYATGYYETSDIRLKNVLSTTDGNIPAITYTWKDGRDNKLHWGYAAQDVMKYLPDAVSGSEYYGLDYNQVHTYKIAIIEDEVTILKRRVAELESKLN